tara:strand:+ start:870 stop:1460 length:591 start_codon:yes stop_codon:yes gene_type:complete
MKILLIIFVLFLSTSVLSDDISDFEIEGLSIGDSLLEYFSNDFIQNNTDKEQYNYLNDPYKYLELFLVNYDNQSNYELKQYHALKIFYENKTNYLINGISGVLFYPTNYDQCLKKKNEIFLELSNIFKNVDVEGPVKESHIADKSGKSKIERYIFWFHKDDLIMISCYNWSNEMNFYDNLKIEIYTNDLNLWSVGK